MPPWTLTNWSKRSYFAVKETQHRRPKQGQREVTCPRLRTIRSYADLRPCGGHDATDLCVETGSPLSGIRPTGLVAGPSPLPPDEGVDEDLDRAALVRTFVCISFVVLSGLIAAETDAN